MMRNEVEAANKGHQHGRSNGDHGWGDSRQATLLAFELLFCVAKVPAGRDVHNLVVPLSFRCIYSFVSPPCYLSDGALTR